MSNAAVMEAVRHTYITGAGATQIVANTPGGGKVGKTLVALVSWRGIGVSSPVEAGWTERYDYPDTIGPQLALYTRPATDTDAATYAFNFSGVATRVVATLWYISNSVNGIEVFSVEASGNSLNAAAPTPVSPGLDRTAIRIWNRSHTNNQNVPDPQNIFLRWNTGGSDAGAVGHVATAEVVGAGAIPVKTASFDVSAREWRSVALIVGPGTESLSVMDRLMLQLSGFTGTVSDRERQRLLHLLQVQIPSGFSPDSLMDLYSLAEITGQSYSRPKIY